MPIALCALAAALGCRPSPRVVSEAAQVESTVDAPTVELTLTRLQDDVWLHTSTRELAPYGRVISHGLVVRGPEGVVLVDSAWGDDATVELLAEVERVVGGRPVAAVITDFHDDRAGGVQALHAAGVEVYTSAGIIRRIGADAFATPISTPVTGLSPGGVDVEVFDPGPGHSPENLVVWLPEHEVLFGGCLVRPFGSRGLGNTGDADLAHWGPAIRAVKRRYPAAATIVPSHGSPGSIELLDHTLALVEAGAYAKAEKTGETLPPIRMAVTVDDLPRHGPLLEGTTRTTIHEDLLAAFERHGLEQVWGFVNGARAETDDERQALARWSNAGHPLGNHTWSHPDLRSTSIPDFVADIRRNEALLAKLAGADGGERWKVFRYPFLQQGIDDASTTAIRAHLSTAGYTVAEVSLDFWDWDYQKPFARCRAAKSDTSVAALQRTYLRQAVATLDWNTRAAIDAFGRPIAHVLLLHAGALTAEMIEPLLTAYEARGVTWIPLEEALADPVYRDVPLPPKTRGDTIVEQAVESLGADHPPWLVHPGALLRELCPSPAPSR